MLAHTNTLTQSSWALIEISYLLAIAFNVLAKKREHTAAKYGDVFFIIKAVSFAQQRLQCHY